MASLLWLSTFLLKRMADLVRLSTCPELSQKVCRVALIVVASCIVACPHRIRSSAKRKEWIGGQPGPSVTPVRFAR
jgi:hypothetical protein